MKRINFNVGETLYMTNLEYIGEGTPQIKKDGQFRRMVKVKCPCGNIFLGRLSTIRNRKLFNCGCGADTGFVKHGLSNTRVYSSWKNAKARCYRKNHPRYPLYGGRGITMADYWVKDYRRFYNYVISLPGYGIKGLSIDRKDNNGNYEEGNLRWATQSEQVNNRRPRNEW